MSARGPPLLVTNPQLITKGAYIMGRKEVPFSDISGEPILSEPDRVMLVVRREGDEQPKVLDAKREEVVEQIQKLALKSAVQVSLHIPGEDEPMSFVLEGRNFDKLSPNKPMAELLEEAPTLKKLGRNALNGVGTEEQKDYRSFEWAGTPHKGKTTDQEKRMIQTRFDEINERLAAQGKRQIDISNKDHVERYGLEELAKERGVTPA
jgi:hypothetical protein